MSEYQEHLTKWKHPSDYGGFSPDGDYVILLRTRDSTILDNSNYELAFQQLQDIASNHRTDELDPDKYVYDFRAGHWACGWIEYIIVEADSPQPILDLAAEIVCALADYPVLDESDYSDRQYKEMTDYYDQCALSERMEWCNEAGLSIFAARPNGEFPWESLGQSEMFY